MNEALGIIKPNKIKDLRDKIERDNSKAYEGI